MSVQMPTKNNEIDTVEAAEKAGVSQETIRNWIRDFKAFKIGTKKGGRWVVYRDKLDKILSGEIHYDNQGRPKKS